MAENILINFEVDSSGLAPAVDQLERLGAIDKEAAAAFRATNAELGKRTQQLGAINKAAQQSGSATKKTIDDLDKSVQKLTQDIIEGMQEGVADALKEAGVSAKEFSDALAKGNTEVEKSSETVRQRLRAITEQLQVMKAEGQDNTEQYRQLTKEAGNLADALGDVSQEIRGAAANSQTLEGMIGIASAVAGGFAVAQGAIALFGAENEELQETLLRVNAAMAILQGLQQINNTLQKESAAAKAADVIITKLQTAAQVAYNVVVGTSTGLLKAFRIALAATGIGIFILAITELVLWLSRTEDSLRRVNNLLERNENIINADTAAIQDLTKAEEARAEAAGAAESELIRIRGRSLLQQREAILQANLLLAAERDRLDSTTEGYAKLNAAIEENNAKIKELDQAAALEGIQLEAQLRSERLQGIADVAAARLAATRKNTADELAAAIEVARANAAIELNEAGQNKSAQLRIERELQREIAALRRQFAIVQQNDRIAATEAALLKEQQRSREINSRISQSEIDLQKRLIRDRANLELLQEGLTANQILAIRQKMLADIVTLQKDFNKQSITETLQDFVSSNNAQLAQVRLSLEQRNRLTEENIIAQAAIEIEAANGVAARIREIEAKRDADVKAHRLQVLNETVENEISLRQAKEGALNRDIEAQLQAQTELRQASTDAELKRLEQLNGRRRLSLQEQLQLVDELTEKEIENIDARIEALNKSLDQGLINRRDYNLQYEQLLDQTDQATEASEKRKTEITKAEEQKRREEVQRTIDFTIETAQQVLQVIQEFFSQQSEAELNRVDEQRKQVEDLRESGAITEKEAQARLKRLDQEERKIRAQQAQRDKQIAIFNAVINTAQAFTRALATGGPVFAAIVAALGAAQIALIASRPIPKFGKGKKNNYQGLAEIGETGSELVEKNGQLYVAPARTIVWLGAKDKVYNPEETRHMLEARGGRAQQIKRVDSTGAASNVMDYEKLGKVIARNTPGLSLNIDGYKDFVIQGHAFNTYLNNRRSYK